MPTTWIDTDYGTFLIRATPRGISELRMVEMEVPRVADPPRNSHLRAAARQLREYLDGERREFDLQLDWSGATDFHRSVWEELLAIGYGRTVSYQYIADRIGDPKACQAVGQANRRNPIAIVVPCHRVIAKTGELQGYFYGLDFKRRLLALENPKSFAPQGSLF